MVGSSCCRILFNLLIATLVILSTGRGSQATDKQTLAQDSFEKIFKEIITQDSPVPPEDITISGITAQPESLEVPTGEVSYQLLNRQKADRLGRKTVTLAIQVNDVEYGRVRIQGELRLLGEVLYTTRALKRDTVLGPEDIRLVRRDITMLGSDLANNPQTVIGKKLNTSLTAGAILYASLLTDPPLVERGDLVTIQVRSANLLLSTQGEARSAGISGEFVRVKNLVSRKEIFARVVNSGTVEAIIR